MKSGRIRKKIIFILFVLILIGPFFINHSLIIKADEPEIIAYWSFDERNGDIAYDEAGSNNGMIHGAIMTEGIKENGLEFDGKNDYIEVQNNEDIQLKGDMTITLWVHPYGMQNGAPLIVKNIPGNTGKGYSIFIRQDNSLTSSIGSSGSRKINYNNPIPVNKWTHIAIVNVDGEKNQIFINGILVAENVDSSFLESDTYNLKIGGDPFEGRGFFNGLIDEVIIYNYALTQEDIYKKNPLLKEQEKAYWNFDEQDGNIVYDLIGNNNGIVHGPSRREGIIGNALEFDGKDDYVLIHDSDDLDFFDTSFSISFWCYPTKTATPMEIFFKAHSNINDDGSWSIRTHSDDLRLSFINKDGGSTNGYTKANLLLNQWSMVTMVYDNNNEVFQTYINGNLDYKIDNNFNLQNTKRDLYIGSVQAEKFFFKGLLDEIKIYHNALSHDEIISLYSSVIDSNFDTDTNYNISIFEEGWNGYRINKEKWSFVDNIVLNHLGHKSIIFRQKLYINAFIDVTSLCGIISKDRFPIDTKMTVDFEIRKIKVMNDFQSIMDIRKSNNMDDKARLTDNMFFELIAGNDENRILFIRDLDGTHYPLGKYIPNNWYSIKIIFTALDTRISVNGMEAIIPRSFPNYHVHFGGHVQRTTFDSLKIFKKFTKEKEDPIPDLFVIDEDINFSKMKPKTGEEITIYSSIHNQGFCDCTALVYFYDNYDLIGMDDITVKPGGTAIASVDFTPEEKKVYTFNVSIEKSYPAEQNINNNYAIKKLNVSDQGNPKLILSVGKWSHVEILENSYKKIPLSIICYNGTVQNVHINILNQENLSITPTTPYINLNNEEEMNYYLNISSSDLPINTSSFTDTIYLQAIGENGIASDIEYMQVTVHMDIPDTPDFTISMMITVSGIGALVAFFRRGNRNRKI